MKKTSKNRQIDTKLTKQIRIDSGIHHIIKLKAAESQQSIKDLVEASLADVLAVDTKS